MKKENQRLKSKVASLGAEKEQLQEDLMNCNHCDEIPLVPEEAKNLFAGLCVVCLEKKADYVILPCGHVCVCINCSQIVEKCPMCLKNIEGVKHVIFNSSAANYNEYVLDFGL